MPLIAAAAIGAAGSIGQGAIGSKSSKSAAKKQGEADLSAANLVQKSAYNAQQGLQSAQGTLNDLWAGEQNNLTPYMNAGTQGVSSLASALSPGGQLAQQFHAPTAAEAAATPGEQFMLQQGQRAIDRSAASKGGLNSGATLMASQAYGQGLASTSYQQAYNNALNTFQTNHNNTLGGLLALTGVGQNATGQYNQASQNYGGNNLTDLTQQGIFGLQGGLAAGNFLANQGQANANGALGAGQAWGNTLGSVTNTATNAVNPYGIGGTPTGSKTSNRYPMDENPMGLSVNQYPTGTMNVGPQVG